MNQRNSCSYTSWRDSTILRIGSSSEVAVARFEFDESPKYACVHRSAAAIGARMICASCWAFPACVFMLNGSSCADSFSCHMPAAPRVPAVIPSGGTCAVSIDAR